MSQTAELWLLSKKEEVAKIELIKKVGALKLLPEMMYYVSK